MSVLFVLLFISFVFCWVAPVTLNCTYSPSLFVSVSPVALNSSANILEYIADIADQRGLGSGTNKYLGADSIERYHHRAHANAVSATATLFSSQSWRSVPLYIFTCVLGRGSLHREQGLARQGGRTRQLRHRVPPQVVLLLHRTSDNTRIGLFST
jgi:hypothetical protein